MARKKNIHAPETLQKGDALPPDVQAMVAQMARKKAGFSNARRTPYAGLWTVILTIVSIVYLIPVAMVFVNSFKKKIFINKNPFSFPNEKTFVVLN